MDMPRVFRTLALACVAVVVGSCVSGRSQSGDGSSGSGGSCEGPSAACLERWMSGSFTSRDQALADPEYFEIELRMAPIWPGRADGPWLYVEQARADSRDRPYRQRVYRLGRESGSGAPSGVFFSEVYTLPEPVGRFTGAWADESRVVFKGISPRDLTLLDGCTVRLRWDPQRRVFTGGTEGTGCASTRQGAAYTTSQIELADGLLTSWDRGFDAAGRQVWGARAGGYRFVRFAD